MNHSYKKDGIHKLYSPEIAKRIEERATKVTDVPVERSRPVQGEPYEIPPSPVMEKLSSAPQTVTDDFSNFPLPLKHIPTYMPGFLLDIDRMNDMYRMPTVTAYYEAVERLPQFKSILEEECKEIDQIINLPRTETSEGAVMHAVRVELADLLGDIIVYCASEAKRWGIPIDKVLSIIMQSNFSKLDSNGQPIYDERMKLMKGPNYWPPEPKIAELLTPTTLKPVGE